MKKQRRNLWDKYIDKIFSLEEISIELKHKVKEAYSFLRLEFGETFLSKAVRGHALNLKIFNTAPWQLEDLVLFVDTLKKLKNDKSNYDRLIQKLKARDRSRSEGIPMVELSGMLLKIGLEPKIEPMVQSLKKPDLEITNTDNGDIIYGEVSVLNDSEERTNKSNDYYLLFHLIEMTPPYLHYSGKQKRLLSRKESDQIEDFIIDCKKKTLISNSFEIIENEFIQIAFAVEEKLDELRNWAESNGFHFDHFHGLELSFDESKRIANNKIREKANQLPKDFNGIIFIKVNPLFFYSDGISNTIAMVQHELTKYKHVLCTVIYSILGDPVESGLYQIDGSIINCKSLTRRSTRFTLSIINKEVELKVQEDTLRKVKSLLYEY